MNLKKRLLIIADLVIFAVAYGVSFVITTNVEAQRATLERFLATLPAVLIVKALVFYAVGVFKDITSYVSVVQLQTMTKGAVFSMLVLYSLSAFYIGGSTAFPPYLFVVDCLCTAFLLAAKRLLPMSFWGKGKIFGKKGLRRVLIVGAGEAGELVVHEILKHHTLPYLPVCFVDDDTFKIGKYIHGIPVVGTVAEIERITKEKEIDEILIAIASASGKDIRRIVESAKQLKMPITTVPSLADLINGRARVQEIRAVNVNDLLRRNPIRIDTTKVAEYLCGTSVLITGAGGSIGSELSRQVCTFRPSRLYLLDHAEGNLFAIAQELKRYETEIEIIPLLGSITDAQRVGDMITHARPDIIFHTAAYKHVSLLESFPHEAFRNNVLGTKNLAQAAMDTGVKRFVLVSTDKAVDPVCVMGCTKKIAERFITNIVPHDPTGTKFITVRFGNVLGSTGSVVPIFEQQIQNKEPLTVTHRDATRYFMTIEEAAQLIMQAGVMGGGDETFLLKMGEPVRIVDLAKNLITLSGLVPDEDMKIVYTGLKPGEKLHEKLVGEAEVEMPTIHDEITVVKDMTVYDSVLLEQALSYLENHYRTMSEEELTRHLIRLAHRAAAVIV